MGLMQEERSLRAGRFWREKLRSAGGQGSPAYGPGLTEWSVEGVGSAQGPAGGAPTSVQLGAAQRLPSDRARASEPPSSAALSAPARRGAGVLPLARAALPSPLGPRCWPPLSPREPLLASLRRAFCKTSLPEFLS